VWDWLWDAAASCYKGPSLNQCNVGQWRVQVFTLTRLLHRLPLLHRPNANSESYADAFANAESDTISYSEPDA